MNGLLLAARRPLALAIITAAVISGWVVSPWMLAIGLGVYALLVGTLARDPAFVADAERDQSRERITSPTFRLLVERIDQTDDEIESSATQAEEPLRGLLTSISTQSKHLINQAHDLAFKGQQIEQYLNRTKFSQIQDQINRLDEKLSATNDQYTQQQMQQTRAALVERINNAQALETYIGRISAQLQNIGANLENVLTETIRLRAAEVADIDLNKNTVAQQLRDLNADMSAFQQVLETALVQSGAAPQP